MKLTTTGHRLRTVATPISNASDFTVFLQAVDLATLTNASHYKNLIALFTGGSENYSAPYLTLRMAYDAGQTKDYLQLKTDSGNVSASTYLTQGTWQTGGIALTYNATTHVLTLYANGVSIGTTTRDFSATAFTSILIGGDADANNRSNVGIRYVRAWQAILTAAQILAEAESANAVVTTNLVLDSPLELAIDLIDRADPTLTWVQAAGAPLDYFPGPLAEGDAAFIAVPESQETLIYDSAGRLLMSSPALHADDRVWNVCPTRSGHLWTNTIDHVTGKSVLRNISQTTGEVLTTLTLDIIVGEDDGDHALHELPDGSLLTVNNTSHALIRINAITGVVDHTYAITANPFDGAVNAEGTRLALANGTQLQIYDLDTEALTCLRAVGETVRWPVWLADCSLCFFTGDYLQDGDVWRIAPDGSLLQIYHYTLTPALAEGVYGIAASILNNRVWVLGAYDADGDIDSLPALIPFNLQTGTQLPLVPMVFQTDLGASSAMQAIYTDVDCDGCSLIPTLSPNGGLWTLKGLNLAYQRLKGVKRSDPE